MPSRSAVSATDRSLGRATTCTIFENRSTTVMIVLLPLEVRRPVTKSRAMSDHSRPGMGRGRRRPAGGRWEVLLREQTSCRQPRTPGRLPQGWATRSVSGIHPTAGVAPLKYLAAHSGWDEQAVPGAPFRIRLGTLGHPNRRFDPPGDNAYHPGRREDGVFG